MYNPQLIVILTQKKKIKKHRKKKPTSSFDNDTDTDDRNGFDRTYSGTNNGFPGTSSDDGKSKESSDPNNVTIGSVLNK